MSTTNKTSGIVTAIAELNAETVVSEQGLADLLGKHRVSIKRAVRRRELPAPIRLFGESVWTVQALRDHLAKRLEHARVEAEREARRISALSA